MRADADQRGISVNTTCCSCVYAGLQSVTISNVILQSTDSFPNHAIDLATLLRPPHVPASTAAVNLTNVALLHSVTAAQAAVAVATLRGVVSDPIVQRGIANWELQLYTVSYSGAAAQAPMTVSRSAAADCSTRSIAAHQEPTGIVCGLLGDRAEVVLEHISSWSAVCIIAAAQWGCNPEPSTAVAVARVIQVKHL